MATKDDIKEIVAGVMRERGRRDDLQAVEQVAREIRDRLNARGLGGDQRSLQAALAHAQSILQDAKTVLQDATAASVEFHTSCLALLYRAAHAKGENPEKVQRAREAWVLMRDARLFSFEPHVYTWLHKTVDRYTTEELVGLPYLAKGHGDPIRAEETKKYNELMWHHAKHAEFPQNWPFETIFVGFGQGVNMAPSDFLLRSHYYAEEAGGVLETAVIRGLLISTRNGGSVIEMADYVFRMPDGSLDSALIPEWMRSNGSSTRGFSLSPWIVQYLCWMLNSYRKFVEETKRSTNERYTSSKLIKRLTGKADQAVGWLPRPYYVVTMKPELLDELTRKPSGGPAFRYSYRFDVRGHERIRVRRGMLPLDAKTEKKLTDKGYKVYQSEIDDADLKKLFARHMAPKRVNEWVAVLTTWVDSYQKGPENAPYIPAVRVPAPGYEPC